jgi:hypothetical protein
MKKKNTPQPRNYLVKLALFRKAGSHRKSNKAVRRSEKSKKSCYSEVYKALVVWLKNDYLNLPPVGTR